MTQQPSKINKHVWVMILIVIGMFGFCYALVPLYNVFCKVTGINGKTPNEVALPITKVDTSRWITVELLAHPDMGANVEFKSMNKKFKVHPGEYVDTTYFVKNLKNEPMTVQAIPSVAPGLAAKHFKKIVCFCFQRQDLEANQVMVMPLKFTVDPKLPDRYTQLTLSYTLFDVT